MQGFPNSISCSTNEVACHGIPDDRPLAVGDLVTIDVAVFKDGCHGDCSRTFLISPEDNNNNNNSSSNSNNSNNNSNNSESLPSDWEERRHLMTTAKECLNAGISTCGPEVPFRKIGHTIYALARRRKVTTLTSICGHGIGRRLHATPTIYHTLNSYPGVMQPGMVFTIGPCLSLGEGGNKRIRPMAPRPGESPDELVGADAQPMVTLDNRPTAQFEDTVLVTDRGVEVLTSSLFSS